MLFEPEYSYENLDKVDWMELSCNPNAIPILEKHLDKVDWFVLSDNPNAIHILEKNLDKVDWEGLSINSNAMHILFPYDYPAMRNKMQTLCRELTEYVFHPVRLVLICDSYSMELEEYIDRIS